MFAALERLLSLQKVQNENQLRGFYNTFNNALDTLRTNNIFVEGWGELLAFILLSKLDKDSRKDFELGAKDPKAIPAVDEVKDFIERRLQAIGEPKPSVKTLALKQEKKGTANKNQETDSYAEKGLGKAPQCSCCMGRHALFKCPSFTSNS